MNNMSRIHPFPEGVEWGAKRAFSANHWTYPDGLLELSLDSHRPIFFKDEIRVRVLGDAHACERYVRVLGNAFPGATIAYDEDLEDLTIELPKEPVQVGLTRFF